MDNKETLYNILEGYRDGSYSFDECWNKIQAVLSEKEDSFKTPSHTEDKKDLIDSIIYTVTECTDNLDAYNIIYQKVSDVLSKKVPSHTVESKQEDLWAEFWEDYKNGVAPTSKYLIVKK